MSVLGAVLILPSACSSDNHRVVQASDGGEAGAGGDGHSQSAAGAKADEGGDANFGGMPDTLQSEAGASSAGAAGAGGGVPTVTSFGCFVRSGDGLDLLANGQPAVPLASSAPYGAACSLAWISDNAQAFAPETPPTTIVFKREFIVDPSILATGSFTIAYEADDAAEVILNGESFDACNPTAANAGNCQQNCIPLLLPPTSSEATGRSIHWKFG